MARAAFSVFALFFLLLSFPATAAEKESAYERVMRTGVIRCGYWNWPPLFVKDAADGKNSGIFYELTMYIGNALGLEVEWTKEVAFSSFEQDLITGKIDAVCAGVWPKAARSRTMEFSDPVFYVPMNVYVRAGDNRFDGNLSALNSPDVTFSGMDGLVEAAIVAQDFPKALRTALPDTAGVSEIFLMVKDAKADAVIADVFTATDFLENNAASLKAIKSDHPIRYFGNTIAVAKGEQELVNMLNTALEEAQSAGVTEAFIKKHERVPNNLLRVAKPYQNTP